MDEEKLTKGKLPYNNECVLCVLVGPPRITLASGTLSKLGKEADAKLLVIHQELRKASPLEVPVRKDASGL